MTRQSIARRGWFDSLPGAALRQLAFRFNSMFTLGPLFVWELAPVAATKQLQTPSQLTQKPFWYGLLAAVLCALSFVLGPARCTADEPAANPPEETKAAVSFRSAVAPILLEHCTACHNAKKAEGGYRIDSFAELTQAGDSGEPPIAEADDAAAREMGSELLRRLTCDESERMPEGMDALPPEQIETVRLWIASGADYDGGEPSTPLNLVIPPVTYANPPDSYPRPLPVTAAIFTPDGKSVVAGGYHELTVWDPQDQKLLRRIPNIGQRVYALEFASDGRTLAVACGEPGKSGEVRLIDFESGVVEAVIARTSDIVLDLAFQPGSNRLAVASSDSTIHIFDTETLVEQHTIASHADWVTSVCWSDDGTRLASSSRDKSAKVYETQAFELLTSYLGHGTAVRGLTILPDGKQIVSAGADGKLHRWDIEGGKKVAQMDAGGECFRIERGDGFLVVPSAGKRVLRIELADNKTSLLFDGHHDWVLTADISDQRLLSGSFDGELRIWNVADGTQLQAWIAKP